MALFKRRDTERVLGGLAGDGQTGVELMTRTRAARRARSDRQVTVRVDEGTTPPQRLYRRTTRKD